MQRFMRRLADLGKYDLYAIVSHIALDDGGKTFPQDARLARCERDQHPRTNGGEMRNIQSGVTQSAA
jgi:hypothetical protein